MSESNIPQVQKDIAHETASAAAHSPQNKKSFKASLLKWSTALPAFSYLLACVSENAFFGKHPLWELLRGTGEGGN